MYVAQSEKGKQSAKNNGISLSSSYLVVFSLSSSCSQYDKNKLKLCQDYKQNLRIRSRFRFQGCGRVLMALVKSWKPWEKFSSERLLVRREIPSPLEQPAPENTTDSRSSTEYHSQTSHRFRAARESSHESAPCRRCQRLEQKWPGHTISSFLLLPQHSFQTYNRDKTK